MFILYTGQFFETETAIIRAKQGGPRVRSLASKIQTTNADNRLALIYFALVKMGDNLTAETVARKGVARGFWADVPTEGRDFTIRASGREYGSARLSDYLGVPQDARLTEVIGAAKLAREATQEATETAETETAETAETETAETETETQEATETETAETETARKRTRA